MITDGQRLHYRTVKNLSALLKGVSSNHVGDFSCLNCFHCYRTKSKLKKHERVCSYRDYCYAEMPNQDNEFIKYYYGEKSLKVTGIIYADLECLPEKMHLCQNNLEKSYTDKSYSLFTNCSLDATKSKLDRYRGKHCMEKFCKDVRVHTMEIINYEEKEMIPLTIEENEYYEMQKFRHYLIFVQSLAIDRRIVSKDLNANLIKNTKQALKYFLRKSNIDKLF